MSAAGDAARRMKRSMTGHRRYRRLLSQSQLRSLPEPDALALERHLRACPACRAVERDYRLQHEVLRSLAPVPPPRDLWARTETALDREMARASHRGRPRGRRSFGLPRRHRSPALVLTSITSVVLSGVLVGTVMSPGARRPDEAAPAVAPTPFEIPSQELSLVAYADGTLAVYQTRVSQVCPPPSVDCVDPNAQTRRVIRLPRDVSPRSVAVDATNSRLAMLARDRRGSESVAVLVVGAGPVPIDRPPAAAADGSGTTATAPVEHVTGDPSEDGAGGVTRTQRPRTTGWLLETSREPGTGMSPPSQGPDDRSPEIDGSSPDAESGDPSPASTGVPSGTSSAARRFKEILDDVRATGAQPAWSPDGQTLAFSAMPADREEGPDVYTWRLGDERARRVTDDHRSYFASWNGERIVLNRLQPQPEALGSAPRVRTYVLDLARGEERVVGTDGLWLPQVDPTGRHAVAWRGALETEAGEAVPQSGELYVVPWRALDPFRNGRSDVGATSPSREPTVDHPNGADETAGPSVEPSDPAIGPSGAPSDAPGGSIGPVEPPADGGEEDATRTEEPAPSEGPPTAEEPPPPIELPGAHLELVAFDGRLTAAAVDLDSDPRLEPVEPDRDGASEPVLDWQVRWDDAGDAFGYWVAETPGGAWGRLHVVPLDPMSGRILHERALLGPILAKRSFSLGEDRIVWVAPAEEDPDGELRVRSWGPLGNATVRLRNLDLQEVIPAF